MRDHDPPACFLAHCHRLNRLSDGPDLVDLAQQGIAGAHLHTLRNTLGVCHEEVVTYNLLLFATVSLEFCVSFPVILIKGVLYRHKWILCKPLLVNSTKLISRLFHLRRTVFILEVQIVQLSVAAVKLRSSHIGANLNLAAVTRFLNGLHQHIQSFVVVLHTGSEAALIPNIASILPIPLLNHTLQCMVYLSTHDQGFLEG
mmetsp:Transcript_62625/g.115424  ORF Transcript_62625/g.115424 Transcript_62625/m.115424 type:complete len:201 (-) Transcript_62625:1211-1813(-)